MRKIVLFSLLLLFPLSLYSQRIEDREYSLQKEKKGTFEIKKINNTTEKNLQWDNIVIEGIFTYVNKDEIIKKKLTYSYKIRNVDDSKEYEYLKDLSIGEILETFLFYFKEEGKDNSIFISITKNRDILILSEE